ncbi:hypothetical protein CLAIMM_02275 [Cladophialophora immunda]|nr:hypothetical protein CLAIMM_02275 [Cladophialophora immunda]
MSAQTRDCIFSLQEGREIASTEARILKLLHPGSPKKPARSTRSVRSATMAQATEGGSVYLNNPSANQNTASPGMEGADTEISQVKSVHFGRFNDRIQAEVQNLQTGLSTLDGAISELTRQFRKYRKIVSTVGDHYGQEEALMRQIDELEIGKKSIWKEAQDDRDSYFKQITKLKEQHGKEIYDLVERAKAGDLKESEYKQKIQDLAQEHARAEKKRGQELEQRILEFEKEYQQKKEQVEKENAKKIADLENERKDLEEAKAKLTKDLHDRTSERDQEKDLRIMLQEKMQKDMKEVEGELATIKKQYQLEQRPLEF